MSGRGRGRGRGRTRLASGAAAGTRWPVWLRWLAPPLVALCAAQPLQADVGVGSERAVASATTGVAAGSVLDGTGSVIGRDSVIGGTRRVIGGDASAGGQWPSVVALVRVEGFFSPADRQFCGGTVVAPRWVMTAAHCLHDTFDQVLEPASLRVIAGITDLRAETAPEETVVTSLFVHPAYDHVSEEAYHDIALLELATELDAPPVSLFTEDPEVLGTASATVVGWGATEFTTPRRAVYPDALHHAMVPLVPRAICNGPDSYDGYVGEGQLCAGFVEGGVDSCIGDSGGPLFIDDGEGVQQVGVVSYGRGCAEPFYYGIYTGIPSYLGWIADYVELSDTSAVDTSVAQQPRGPSSPGTSTATTALGGPVLRPIEDNTNPFATSGTETADSGAGGSGGGGSTGGVALVLLGLTALGRRRWHHGRRDG